MLRTLTLTLCLSMLACQSNPFEGYNRSMRAANTVLCPVTIDPIRALYHTLLPTPVTSMLAHQSDFVRESFSSPRMIFQGRDVMSLWDRFWVGLFLGGLGSVPISEHLFYPIPMAVDHSWEIEQPILGPTTVYGLAMGYLGQKILTMFIPSHILLPWSGLTRLSKNPSTTYTQPLPKDLL